MSLQSNPASRRQFIKSSSLGALGSAVLLNPSLSRNVHAQGKEEPLKIALIGCGGRGTGAAAQALSTAGPTQLWAMADAYEDRLQSSLSSLRKGLAARYDREKSEPLEEKINVPGERMFVGLDAYRKAIDSGVDVVIITGPPGYRPLHFEYAVQVGKHVFMEKPVATDPHGVQRVLDAAQVAKRKNIKVGVGLQRRHQKSYLDAIQQIHDGAIGEIVNLRCFWNTGFPAKTPVGREASKTELEHQVRNWYFFDWLSGDHICEQHIHNLDISNWIKGALPVEAEGLGGRQVRTGKEFGNIFDHHAVIYTYADGTKLHSYCRQIPGCQNQVAEFAEGTKGSASLANRSRCSLSNRKEVFWQSARRSKENPYQVEHDALFQAIREDLPYNEAEYGATSTMTAVLGRLATYSGKTITWEQAMASNLQIGTDAESWDAAPPISPQEDGSYQVAVPGTTKVI